LEVTDYELIQQCLSGSREMFSELVTRYKRLVYHTIVNFLGNSPEVHDLSQEVFLRIYQSLHRYNPDYPFAPWAVKITTNLCLDRLRRKRHEPVTMDDMVEFTDKRGSPEEQYLEREWREKIRRVVAGLPEKYKVPLILFHQQGLSYEAISQIMDQPMTIVKNRLYRARLMLRDKLKPNGEGGVSDEM